MTDDLSVNYNPFRGQNFGYLQRPVPDNYYVPDSYTYNGTTSVAAQPEDLQISNVNFSAKSNMENADKSPSTGKKILITTGITLALSLIGAAFLYKKGGGRASKKGVPETIKDGWNKLFKSGKKPKSSDIKPANTENLTADKKETIVKTVDIEELSKVKAEPLKQYKSLEEGIADFRQNITNGGYESGKDAEKLLSELIPHNYRGDKSYIEVCTRTRNIDFTRQVLDVENNNVYNWRITPHSDCPEFKTPDSIGSYLIRTLKDGRRVVGISVPAGRADGASGNGRPIRTMITTISKDKEFTPLQKDLIEIISKCQNKVFDRNETDILSIGILCRKESSWQELSRKGLNPFTLNQEVLLSSLKTAKEKAPNTVDKNFVQKALELKNGEQIERVLF